MRQLFGLRVVDPRFRQAFRSLRGGMIAIDCGANVGIYAEVMARSGAQVFAFEPDPHAFGALRQRLGRRRNVTLFGQAVSDRDGRERLYFHERADDDPLGASLGSSLVPDKANVEPTTYTEVDTIDFDAFVASLGGVQLVKMDVEGAEVRILRKLLRTGRIQQIRHLLVELHDWQIPSLVDDAASLRAEVARLRLGGVRLDWA